MILKDIFHSNEISILFFQIHKLSFRGSLSYARAIGLLLILFLIQNGGVLFGMHFSRNLNNPHLYIVNIVMIPCILLYATSNLLFMFNSAFFRN